MPITTLYIFSGGGRSQLEMLRAFGMLRASLRNKNEALFIKAMGCGRGLAFSLLPDWNRYAVIAEWADEAAEIAAWNKTALIRLRKSALHTRRIQLAPFRKRGAWDGKDPFAVEPDSDAAGRVAVLTRAAIAPLKIRAFIRHSHSSTDALEMASGLQLSLGMGEYPLFQQATFTIWENDQAMSAYAYKDITHIAAMKAKSKETLFKEEMFIRFRVVSDEFMA